MAQFIRASLAAKSAAAAAAAAPDRGCSGRHFYGRSVCSRLVLLEARRRRRGRVRKVAAGRPRISALAQLPSMPTSAGERDPVVARSCIESEAARRSRAGPSDRQRRFFSAREHALKATRKSSVAFARTDGGLWTTGEERTVVSGTPDSRTPQTTTSRNLRHAGVDRLRSLAMAAVVLAARTGCFGDATNGEKGRS